MIFNLRRLKQSACNQQISVLRTTGPVYTAWEMMGFNYENTSSKAIDILQNCLEDSEFSITNNITQTSNVLDTTPGNINSPWNSSVSVIKVAPAILTSQCHSLGYFAPVYSNQAAVNQDSCSSFLSLLQNHYSGYLIYDYSFEIKYKDIVKEIFMNTTFDYTSHEDFKQCLEEEKRFPTKKHLETSEKVKEIALNMVRSKVISEALNYAQQIVDNYIDIRDILLHCNDFHSKINEHCYWYSAICDENDIALSEAQTEMYYTVEYLNDVKGWFHKMGNHYNTLHNNYKENIVSVLTKAQDYLLGNITKTKLHMLLEQNTFTVKQDDLLELNADLNEDAKYLIEKVEYIKNSLTNVYNRIVQVKLSILTTRNVRELKMVQLAEDIDDARMQELMESLKHSLNPALPDLVQLTFQRILGAMNEVKEEIIKPMEDLIEEVKALSKSLHEYKESTIMDTNFFM